MVIFVFGAWIGATWFLSDVLALAALVVAAVILVVIALRQPASPVFRTFVSDFGVILMACAVAIALAVLVLTGVTRRPEATLIAVASTVAVVAGLLAARALRHRRSTRRERRAHVVA